MILTDGAILEEIKLGNIVIEPFDRKCLGTNSYDVHLGRTLAVYGNLDWDPSQRPTFAIPAVTLDAAEEAPVTYFDIPDEGFILYPGMLYLGSTVEYTETKTFVPSLEGKSSLGRLGLRIHATAGFGDIGFCNHWTLELDVVMPVRVYAGMPIGQLRYSEVRGEVLVDYGKKASAKYRQRDERPVPSYMWRNFISPSNSGGA